MNEILRPAEGEPGKENVPEYYVILELDQEKPSPTPLILGRRQEEDLEWIPDIDIVGYLGIFKSNLAKKQLIIDVANHNLTLAEESTEDTYHNGRLLEKRERVSLFNNDIINIGNIQLFIQYVTTTTTGKPFYLVKICDRIPTYIKPEHRPRTPWTLGGYSPNDLVDGIPLWIACCALIEAVTWELDFDEVLHVIIKSEETERKKETMRNPLDKYPRPLISERVLQISSMLDKRYEERRKEWLHHHMSRKPIYPPTQEEGEFVGVFGYLVSAWSARNFPYYKTPSGVYFFEWEDHHGENKKSVKIDPEKIGHKWLGEGWLKR